MQLHEALANADSDVEFARRTINDLFGYNPDDLTKVVQELGASALSDEGVKELAKIQLRREWSQT
jgi:hypothetical protein